MFNNYLKIALRNIIKHKAVSFINVLGLAIGMALCILILVYVQDELGYDSFYENADRIYRVAEKEDHNGKIEDYVRTGPGITTKMETDFPDIVEKTVRVMPAGQDVVWVKIGDKRFREDRTYVADSTFFEMFSSEFVKGTQDTALTEPNSLVITESTAEKYFKNEDALGKILRIDIPGVPLLKITGVVKDVPSNSHFHFDLLVSMSTIRNEQNARFFDLMYGNAVWSYILVKENYPIEELEAQLPAFLDRHLNQTQKKILKSLYFQPLKDIHLHSHTWSEIETEKSGNILYLYIFSAIAFLILLIACINFMNLATARSVNRAREVGLRKVIGATRRQLINQFIGESIIISFVALPLAILVSYLFLPVFNSLSNKEMSIAYFANPILLLGLIGIILFVGFFSGSYPAFFLSAFKPVDIIRGKLKAGTKSAILRKILVVFQFAVSIGFVVGAIFILRQMYFMRNTDLGFNKENVVIVQVNLPVPAAMRANTMEYLKREYLQHPGVSSVSMTSGVPSDIRGIVNGRVEGTPADEATLMVWVATEHDFVKTLEIEIKEGRDFSKEFSTDLKDSFIINEAVAQKLNLESPVGKRIVVGGRNGTVVGIFKTLHWEPKLREIFPMVFYVEPNRCNKLAVKVNPENIPETLAFMEKKWQENVTNRPFQYEFLEDMLDNLYKSEQRLSSVVKYLTVLTIFIACLGLFGLASFMAEQRTKEIGIRKVVGASISRIVMLLSKEYAKLIVIANVIALPVTYFIMRDWLQNFYYRIKLGLEWFVLSAVLVLVIALISVSYQAMRAASADPVDALRFE
ncbi:MAG: ABC transporter permease [Candidatus Aminicenantes bacterium]|nr:ABC transporter permease [Candidatus Aminicenantes bacterium]